MGSRVSEACEQALGAQDLGCRRGGWVSGKFKTVLVKWSQSSD